MVGADVGEDRRIVRLVAHAPEHHAAARGLEDRDVDVRVPAGPARPSGPVRSPASTSTLVEQDAIRGGRARHAGRPRAQDVADHAGVVVVLPLVPLMLTMGMLPRPCPGSMPARRCRHPGSPERPGSASVTGRGARACAGSRDGRARVQVQVHQPQRGLRRSPGHGRPHATGRPRPRLPGSDVRWMLTGMRARPWDVARPSSTSHASAPDRWWSVPIHAARSAHGPGCRGPGDRRAKPHPGMRAG